MARNGPEVADGWRGRVRSTRRSVTTEFEGIPENFVLVKRIVVELIRQIR